MLKVYKHILNIDDLGNRIFSKVLFALLVILKVFSNVSPIGDTDFNPVYKWSQDMLSNPELLMNQSVSDIPFSTGNLIYILFILAIDFIILIGAILYCGLYVRDYRTKTLKRLPSIPFKVVSLSTLLIRTFFIALIIVFLFVPIAIFVLYLPLIFIIIFPCLIVFFGCYLSGDYPFFKSVPTAIKRTKGFYLLIMRDLSTMMLLYFILEYLLEYIGLNIPVVSYVVAPFAYVFIFLVIGRYAGFIYCRIIEAPTFIVRRPDVKR